MRSARDAPTEVLLVRHVVAKTGPVSVGAEAGESTESPIQLTARAVNV